MTDPMIYLACHEGWFDFLKKRIAASTPESVRKTLAGKYHRITPLLAAVRNCGQQHMERSCDIVEYLVKECGVDVEQTGSVELFDGDEIHSAPPLWCSAAVGCLRCVRLLVEVGGANVNATTSTNSTPLRAACFDGHLAIVQYLVEAGADMEIANQHGHTCLMISCFKKHLPIAAYLLDRGAQVNRQSVKGNTAMHDAAEANSMEILKLLVRNGAKFLRDCYNLTPLMTAALTGNQSMVYYLKSVFQCKPEEEADAFKLLGATYVDKCNDISAAYDCWQKALIMSRQIKDKAAYRKRLMKPSEELSEAYGEGAKEFASARDLEELYCDLEKMRMQSLIVRERILTINHPETFYFVRFRGAAYADARQLDRCFALWLYNLNQQMEVGIAKPFNDMAHSQYLSILQIFSLMAKQTSSSSVSNRSQPPLATYDVFRVFRLAISELLHPANIFLLYPSDYECSGSNNNNKEDDEGSSGSSKQSKQSRAQNKRYCMRLKHKLPALRPPHRRRRGSCSAKNEVDVLEEEVEEVSPIHELLPHLDAPVATFNGGEGGNAIDRHFLLVVQLAGLMVRLRPQMSPEEWLCFQKVLYTFVRMEPRSSTSYTLLHILTFVTPEELPLATLPVAPMGDLFEQAVNVSRGLDMIDLEGNTALHLLFKQMGQQQAKALLKLRQDQEAKKAKEESKKAKLVDQEAEEMVEEEEEEEEEEDATQNNAAAAATALDCSNSGTMQLRRNMAEQLLARGAHLDLVNEEGRSPLDYVDARSLGNHFKVNFLSLACRAASVVVAARLPLDSLSADVRAFVEMHQPKGFSANVYEDAPVLEEEEEEKEEQEDEQQEQELKVIVLDEQEMEALRMLTN